MTIDKQLWRRKFWKASNFPCPHCASGRLVENEEADKSPEPAWSVAIRQEEYWEVEWFVHRFCKTLECSNKECGETSFMVGTAMHEEIFDWDQQTSEYVMYYEPEAFFPAPPIIAVREQYSDAFSDHLRKSFALYWTDAAAAANRLRIGVETMLDERRVKRTTIDKKGKRQKLTLHTRLEEFSKTEKQSADLLMAVKWIGNTGSHSGPAPDDDDLLKAYEIVDYVASLLFANPAKHLAKAAKSINKRKGKPSKP